MLSELALRSQWKETACAPLLNHPVALQGAPESATLILDGISEHLDFGVFVDGAQVPLDRLVWLGNKLEVRGPLGKFEKEA